ncbi:MAG: hypothetical protein IT424_03355 [Pirellulales bacterium]|nr:hypothetical protein [Pirellulales bacterium]
MNRYVQLMSESAQFRAAARKHLRRWGAAAALLVAATAPLGAWQWRHQSQMRQQCEALEASYEPVRRLNGVNRNLRTQAITLVRDERLILELARQRPVTSLLACVAAATSASQGQAFVERLNFEQPVPGSAEKSAPRLTVEVAATLSYDISEFVESLRREPIDAVKVTSDVVTTRDGIDRKTYTLLCEF